jgi:hypothetical protein
VSFDLRHAEDLSRQLACDVDAARLKLSPRLLNEPLDL